ncbi:uncharacterized protein [Chironomus tepperi]|uniref:uncharacterized protein n=1 Tax=Chironomus tepperi TaxID=113505 RepID=UPI00391FAFA0
MVIEATETVEINGTAHFEGEIPKNGPPEAEIPLAKLQEIVVTDYIKEALDKVAVAEGFQNYEFDVDHGSSIGDGFVGIMLKIVIKELESDKTLTVLAKIPPSSKARREQMKVMKLFEREVFIYNVMLPEFAQFQKDKKITEQNGFFNFPKVYYADFSEEKDDGIIIMEDLRESGHRMWSKYNPVNLEHAKLLMVALGRLHAVSFAMKAKKPELFEKYKSLGDYFGENFSDPNFQFFMTSTINKAIDCLAPEDVKSRAKAAKLIDYMQTGVSDCMTAECIEPYGIVNHGDCWTNNYLFHYTKRGRPESIVLIDWQISRYCSPVIDLVYFIFICTDHQLRAKHYDELLNIYHHSLKELLDHMGGDTMVQFPFTAFLRHLKRFGKFGVIMACMILPMLQTRNEELMDMDYMAEKMNNPDPAEMEKLMKEYMEKNSGYQTSVVRMREVLHDAIRYGYFKFEMSSEDKKSIPIAKQEEIIVTDYLKECIHKVAIAEGFIDYNLTVNYGSNIGDGYVSNMLKISLNEDNHKTLTVLVKIPLENKARREVMKMMSLFEREIFVYKVMLPHFEEIQKLNNLSESIMFNNYPKIYFAEFNKDKDDAIIIMDDLRESGHKMWKKSAPINFEHAKLLLTALGRYHAMSFAIRSKKHEFFQTLQHLNDDFSDVLQTPQFEVLLKGDCWINNFLFHYSKTDAPDDIKLIDWQITRYGPPAIDLIYFFFICTDHKLRANHFNELLKIYYNSLEEMLHNLDCNANELYPFDVLQNQMKLFGKFGVIMASFILPALITKDEEIVDLDFVMDQNSQEMNEMAEHVVDKMFFSVKLNKMAEIEPIMNGHNEIQATTNGTSSIPLAKLNEIKVSDYVRECLDKVAVSEGFINYTLIFDHGARVGDGFVGQIIKITIKEVNSDKSLNVLAKIPPDSKVRRDQMGAMQLFEREVLIYNTFLPELVEFQKDKHIKESLGFFNFPKCYFAEHSKEQDESIIIMEDLRDSGHRMWEKSKPINYEHAKLLLIALGRLHALSYAFKEQKPEQFEKFKSLVDFFSNDKMDDTMVAMMTNAMRNAVESLDKDDVKRRAKANNLCENLVATLKFALSSENAEPFAIITHGDCWFNNFLYHYQRKDVPDSIVLLDWQIARYVSPVIDLCYFLFMCTDHNLRAKHYDEFLSIYHHSLSEMLARMGCDVMVLFPFTALLRQMKKFGRVAIVFAAMAIPMFVTKSEDLLDMDVAAEQLKDKDPAVLEEIMKQYAEIIGKNADKINERMRGVLHDAIRYGYL